MTPLARKRGGSFALGTLLGIWLVSALLAAPALVFSEQISFNRLLLIVPSLYVSLGVDVISCLKRLLKSCYQ